MELQETQNNQINPEEVEQGWKTQFLISKLTTKQQ